jgi:hypothetical protein
MAVNPVPDVLAIQSENDKKARTLYTKKEKRNTPPYSIVREKFTAMQKRNLLLREKPTKASQTLNEEVSQWTVQNLPGLRSSVN